MTSRVSRSATSWIPACCIASTTNLEQNVMSDRCGERTNGRHARSIPSWSNVIFAADAFWQYLMSLSCVDLVTRMPWLVYPDLEYCFGIKNTVPY